MLYIALGIAAVFVLYFFFENELKENLKKKSSAPKTPQTPKEKTSPVDREETEDEKKKKPDKAKLSLKESDRPVVLDKPKPDIQTVQFEEPPMLKKSSFASESQPKGSVLDKKRVPLSRRHEEPSEDLGHFDILDDETQEAQAKFLRELGSQRDEEDFPTTFQSLPKIVKIMLIDNTIGKIKF